MTLRARRHTISISRPAGRRSHSVSKVRRASVAGPSFINHFYGDEWMCMRDYNPTMEPLKAQKCSAVHNDAMEKCDLATTSSVDLSGSEKLLEKMNLDPRWEDFNVWLLHGETSGLVYAYQID